MRNFHSRGAAILVLFILFFTIGCTEDHIEPDIPEKQTQRVSANETPGLLNAIAPYVNPALADRGDMMSANNGTTYFGMDIDFDNIIARLDSAGHTDFAMRLEDGDGDAFTFSNLVISKDESGQFYQPFIMNYKMTLAFGYQFFRTNSLEGFSGTITKAYLQPIQASSQRSSRSTDPGDYGSDRDQPNTTCPVEVTLSDGTSDAGGNTGGSAYQVCEVVEYTYYEYDANGVKTEWYSVISYENCEWIYPQNSNSDGQTCPEDNSDVPVNPPSDPEEEIEADKPKKEYDTVCDALQELWDQYPKNEVGGYITPEGKLLFTDILPRNGGTMQPLYEYQGAFYYRWNISEGAPAVDHEGLITTGTYHLIPVSSTFHTHSRCRTRYDTDGLQVPGSDDKDLAEAFPTLTHWAIGCGAVGQFKDGVNVFIPKYTGDLKDICSNVK